MIALMPKQPAEVWTVRILGTAIIRTARGKPDRPACLPLHDAIGSAALARMGVHMGENADEKAKTEDQQEYPERRRHNY